MVIVVCDVCGKKMPDAVRGDSPGKGVDYVTYTDKDICTDCYNEMDFAVRKISRAHDPFTLSENKKIMRQVIDQMCAESATTGR